MEQKDYPHYVEIEITLYKNRRQKISKVTLHKDEQELSGAGSCNLTKLEAVTFSVGTDEVIFRGETYCKTSDIAGYPEEGGKPRREISYKKAYWPVNDEDS